MPENTEGYIKFNCQQAKENFEFSEIDFSVLESWRYRFFNLKLIGAYPNGIGFGNISIRYNKSPGFIISASATGNIPHLSKEHYTLVTQFNFKGNSLVYEGKLKASSESLSHAIIYECSTFINAVIHIHNRELWDKLKYQMPTTGKEVEYGTPAMAWEISRILAEFHLENGGLIVMGGHEEGIISFGDTLETAAGFILEKLSNPGM